MEIQVNRDTTKRLYLDVQFQDSLELAKLVVSRGYALENVLYPKPGRVLFVLASGQGPKAANNIIQFLKNNYAVSKLVWRTR